MSPATISMSSREKSIQTPIFRERIFKILIQATMVQTASTSLMIQARVSQQRVMNKSPIMSETTSRSLILDLIGLFNFQCFNSHNVYAEQIVTPMTPIMLPTILSMIAVTDGKKYAKTEPAMTRKLKTIKNLQLISIPKPPQDQARLQKEDRVIVRVQIHMRMKRPHSKGL